jgi:hypothetical protein
MAAEAEENRLINVGILIFDRVEVLDFAGPFEVFSTTRLTPGADSRDTDNDPSQPFRLLSVAKTKGPVVAVGGAQSNSRTRFHILPQSRLAYHPWR